MSTMDWTTQDSLVFRIDEKLLQHRPPRLTLAATLNSLSQRIKLGDLNANFVVDILDEHRLLPYIISNVRNLHNISLGGNTNASKIGDIIVSEECIRGSYDLTIAFLEFIFTVVQCPDYKDSSKTMLASVTYMANEIYPSHTIWIYKNISDMNRILCLCTDIFNHIIAKVTQCSEDSIQIVCVLSLSQNQAHKQLLNVIVDGKDSIHKASIEPRNDTETSSEDDQIIKCARQSLFIFNRLLSSGDLIKRYCDSEVIQPNSSPGNYQHGASSASTPITNVEKALFDTSIRPGLLQHLFSYIYQKVDGSAACLTVDLIKNIAKKFSMSLMASLGSEAEKVCEFFINCLDDENTNVDLEVAILDLLSTCVKYQPGLIEMFLTFKNVTPNNNTADKGGSTALDVVMKLFGRCQQVQDDAHKLIHTYLMKFILTFWQKNHSAVDQLDKAQAFWESVTYPLINFLKTELVNNNSNAATRSTIYSNSQALIDKLNSYSLMILARGIFGFSVGVNDRKMNPKLNDRFKELSEQSLLSKYSAFIKNRYSNIRENLSKGEDYSRLLSGWRDFLVSYAKFQPFETSQSVKDQIVEDLLTCLASELQLAEEVDKVRVAVIGETILLIWTKWMQLDSYSDDIFKAIHQILYLTDTCKEHLPFSFLLTFQSTLNLYLLKNRKRLLETRQSFDFIVPALQLTHFSIRVVEKSAMKQTEGSIQLEQLATFDEGYKPSVESRLCQASIMTLRFIIDVSRSDVDLWLSYLQTNLRTDSIVEFLALLMNRRFGPEICLAIVELLLCLSTIHETADYLNKSALVEQVNMIAVSAYQRPCTTSVELKQTSSATSIPTTPATETATSVSLMNRSRVASASTPTAITPSTTNPSDRAQPKANSCNGSTEKKVFSDNINYDLKWHPIYWHVICLNISMMLTLESEFMSTAVEFLTIHSSRICELIELLRTRPRSINMQEALQVIYLINLVLNHGCLWSRRNKSSYQSVSDEIAKTAYTLATSALPPPTTDEEQNQRTSLRPKDCLVYARCCYNFGKYTEAERVLFQTKFGDKNGFINEASQIYGDDLSKYAFQLAAMICIKTNRQTEAIDFALQVFSDDSQHLDIINALSQDRCGCL